MAHLSVQIHQVESVHANHDLDLPEVDVFLRSVRKFLEGFDVTGCRVDSHNLGVHNE